MTEKQKSLKVVLEEAIRSVLADANADVKDKIQAINAGTKLEIAKFKIDGSDEEGAFFSRRKRK